LGWDYDFPHGKGHFWLDLAFPTRESAFLAGSGISHAGKRILGWIWHFPSGRSHFWLDLSLPVRESALGAGFGVSRR
jgi:hypothetical protein